MHPKHKSPGASPSSAKRRQRATRRGCPPTWPYPAPPLVAASAKKVIFCLGLGHRSTCVRLGGTPPKTVFSSQPQNGALKKHRHTPKQKAVRASYSPGNIRQPKETPLTADRQGSRAPARPIGAAAASPACHRPRPADGLGLARKGALESVVLGVVSLLLAWIGGKNQTSNFGGGREDPHNSASLYLLVWIGLNSDLKLWILWVNGKRLLHQTTNPSNQPGG